MNSQGTHSTKMGADKSAENTPNAGKLSAQIVWDFDEKKSSLGLGCPCF